MCPLLMTKGDLLLKACHVAGTLPYNNSVVCGGVFSLYMKEWRLREVRWFTQCHTAGLNGFTTTNVWLLMSALLFPYWEGVGQMLIHEVGRSKEIIMFPKG